MTKVVLAGSWRKVHTIYGDYENEENFVENLKKLSENFKKVKLGVFVIQSLAEQKRTRKMLFNALKNLGLGFGKLRAQLYFGYESGNGPLIALHAACQKILNKELDFAIIAGYDNLMTGYGGNENVLRLMANTYGKEMAKLGLNVPIAYTLLAKFFCKYHKIENEKFLKLSEMIHENLRKTAKNVPYKINVNENINKVTDLFKIHDCAAPWLDFSGAVILANEEFSNKIGINGEKIYVSGVSCSQISETKNKKIEYAVPAYVDVIGKFNHLEKVIADACKQAKIGKGDVCNSATLLEAYTCYPIIPLALAAKISPHNIDGFLDHPLTVTGGMYYAGAPWCNPALNGLIALHEGLVNEKDKRVAVLHGNGGTGEYQGICILKKDSENKLKPSFYCFDVGKSEYNKDLNGRADGELLCEAIFERGNKYTMQLRQLKNFRFFTSVK